jgi:hypothetical protein
LIANACERPTLTGICESVGCPYVGWVNSIFTGRESKSSISAGRSGILGGGYLGAYDSFTECVEKSFIAHVPAFAKLGQKERSRIVSAVNEEMATTLARYVDEGGAINFPQPTNVAVART